MHYLAMPTDSDVAEQFRTLIDRLKESFDVGTGITLGYEFDSMAIGEVVKLTEIVLADHKDILSKAENAANLGTVLDVFLSAGWPEATQLVMRLENAVR
jgi:hypothetical protein